MLTFTSPALTQATLNEDDMVQCFNDVTSCNANSNVMMITAGQCCNSAGGSTRRVRVVSFCTSCFGEFIKNANKVLEWQLYHHYLITQTIRDIRQLSKSFRNYQ